jgi:hypothetical protein
MISFANINKQYGKQLLLVDASFQLNPGEKAGLADGPPPALPSLQTKIAVGPFDPVFFGSNGYGGYV